MTAILVFSLMFLLAFAAALVAAGVMWVLQPETGRLQEGGEEEGRAGYAAGETALIKDEGLSTIAVWAGLLRNISHVETLKKWLEEADLEWSVGRVTLGMLLAASAVYALAWQAILMPPGLALMFALAAGTIPVGLIRALRQRRFKRFGEQFPEALDALSRALKAGYPLSAAVELLALEQPEPLAGEMRRLRDQWKLGVGWDAALDDLCGRLPLAEVSMFAAAVKMQNRVGGRLNDVLGRLGESMRDNQVFEAEVRSIAAHSRITGTILTILPVAIWILMYVVNPDYALILARRPEGRMMLAATLAANIAAHFVIRKLTRVRI